MIGKLRGIIDEINSDHIILDVGGVGYKIFLTTSALASLSHNAPGVFNIEMIVREDQMLLYGFNSKLEQKWFNLLQTVQGVGAKVALALLSTFDTDRLLHAIISEDQRTIKTIPGIGPKLAARIVNELKNHQEISGAASNIHTKANVSIGNNPGGAGSIFNDALNALATLGFSRSDGARVLSEVIQEHDALSLEDAIRLSLAKMAS
ncbi:MAG: ruvA [Candidatus Midichloriaceae bacterium]|jgi:Holliday junction DNA helicase RuvA|nr:ruvA [Candidatus Midichloriaceae bacterium]